MNFSEKHTSLTVQGSQAAEFLQGQITIDTEKISNEDFKPACICNNKGRVMATFWIKKVENGFKIVIYANQMLRATYPAMQTVVQSILKNKRSYEIYKECSTMFRYN